MGTINKTPDTLLRNIGLSHEKLAMYYFLENHFFKDLFSNGPIHIAEVTITKVGDFMRSPHISKVLNKDKAWEYLAGYVEHYPNVKRLGLFRSRTKYDFLNHRLCFERVTGIDPTAPVRFLKHGKGRETLDFIPQTDLYMACWIIRHNDAGDNSQDYFVIKRHCVMALEELMEILLNNFHRNIHTNRQRGKYAKSDEVIIRQTAMAFWAAISLRNLLVSGNFKNVESEHVYKWDFGLHHPCRKFEELCNVVNGTSHNYVDDVFDAKFRIQWLPFCGKGYH